MLTHTRIARIIQFMDSALLNIQPEKIMTNTANLTAFAAATNNELFDADYKDGEWMVEFVETQETLDMFQESAKGWNERSAMDSGEIAGFKFISWKNAQAVKGHPRQSMSVIDLGDVRIALPGTNLSNF